MNITTTLATLWQCFIAAFLLTVVSQLSHCPKYTLSPPLPHPTAANFHFLLRRLYHPGKHGSNNSYAKLGGGGVGANKVRNGQCERSKFLFFIFSFYFDTVTTYLIVNEKSSPWSPVLSFSRMIIIVYWIICYIYCNSTTHIHDNYILHLCNNISYNVIE